MLLNYDFAINVGISLCDVRLIIRLLWKRAEGTSLHFDGFATLLRLLDAGSRAGNPAVAEEADEEDGATEDKLGAHGYPHAFQSHGA